MIYLEVTEGSQVCNQVSKILYYLSNILKIKSPCLQNMAGSNQQQNPNQNMPLTLLARTVFEIHDQENLVLREYLPDQGNLESEEAGAPRQCPGIGALLS